MGSEDKKEFNHQEATDILQKQLKKLKNVNNISSSIEGLVFTYNGNTYKLTGNFAPINQILGLLKFGTYTRNKHQK